MKYLISSSSKPAYLQLYEQLREDIFKGNYVYGARLPSKRLLSEELGISVITAEHALSLLCEEGYAQSRERKGYFVIFREGEVFSAPSVACKPRPHAEKAKAEYEFPFSVFARTVRRTLSDYGEELFEKSPNMGCIELRQELSRYLARSRGIKVLPEQIIIGSGSEYLYGFVMEMLGREKIFAIEKPSYDKIRKVYLAGGAKIRELDLGKDGIESSELKLTDADVLHITPYRSFPSGVTATLSKKREYLRWAEMKGRFLVEDDFESEFTLSRKPEDTLFSMTSGENVIYVNTFSRSVAPSIRAGYMVLPQSLLPLYETKLGFYSCTVPRLEQMVLASFLSEGDLERHINRVRRKLRKTEE
ncbi:MAG: PLP-dependent aminotransferase family protein [Clostridia bacterium]|nr:PLP-dependent aminotransferase family protein [Clostridia bacterium]